MDTKDRIKQIMEDQHMTQQVFADFLQQSPATLSSIFNGRTRPTLNVVEAIKKKIPNINTDWLLWGSGEMYLTSSPSSAEPVSDVSEIHSPVQEATIDFDSPAPAFHNSGNFHANGTPSAPASHGVKNTRSEKPYEEIKIIDKPPRHVTEIRVYYDDQTYETFVPAKQS